MYLVKTEGEEEIYQKVDKLDAGRQLTTIDMHSLSVVIVTCHG